MANYDTTVVIQPPIPTHLITEAEREFLEGFNFEIFGGSDGYYLATDQYSASGWLNGECLEEEDLIELLQAFIKSDPTLKWISFEFAHTCSKLRPDGFGGAAFFLTADSFDWISTGEWLSKKLNDIGE